MFHGRGDRSLPSMLGGGDLDGDIYNLILDVSADIFFSTIVKKSDDVFGVA